MPEKDPALWKSLAAGMATLLAGVSAFLSIKVYEFPEKYPSKETFERAIDKLEKTMKETVKALHEEALRREDRTTAHVAGIYARLNEVADRRNQPRKPEEED